MHYVKRNQQNVEEQIQKIIDNQADNRKLVIISGEYGIGKTTLLNEIISMLQYKTYFKISLEKGYNNSPVFLKEVTTKFIESLQIDNTIANRSANWFATIVKFLPGINVGVTNCVSFSFSETKKAILDFVEKRWSTYVSEIDAIEYQGENYIYELVRIIQSAVVTYQSNLYIVIDNFDCLDMQTSIFLNKLNEQIEDLSVILTMESDLEYVKNSLSIRFINNFMHTNKLNKEITLYPFDKVDTKTYLSQHKAFSHTDNIDTLSEKACDFSGGLPLLLSIICDNNEFWITQSEEGKKNINLDMYYRNLLQDASDEKKCILFYFVANEGKIEKDVFRQLTKKDKNEGLRQAFKELYALNVITESEQNYYRIKAPILCDYIKKHIKEYLFDENEYKRKLLKAYCNLSTPQNISEKYSRLVVLAVELGKWDKAYHYAIEGSKTLYVQMKHDTASDILEYILKEVDLLPEQRVFATQELIQHLYNDKRMSLLLDYYYSIQEQLENSIENKLLWSSIHLKAAQAHYYLNQVDKAITIAKKALSKKGNSYIYYKAKLIIISSYDLQGNYDNCFMEYDNALKEIKIDQDLNSDDSLQIMFDTVCQMHLNDAEKCIKQLENAILHKAIIPKRTYICCCNNLGIEYLMDGQFEKSKKYLERAKLLFLTHFPVEVHFALNNLGLYYLYSTSDKDEEKALQLLEQAYNYAISPLQHAYTLMNIANVYFVREDYKAALEKIKLVEEYVKECPDPIVHSYYHYNYACVVYYCGDEEKAKTELKQSYSGLQKPQLALLYEKRNNLAKKLGCDEVIRTGSHEATRRKFWAEQIYEPCELMFYN